MEGLEAILYFKEIDDIINDNKQLTTEQKKLDKIMKQINPETKKKLIELNQDKIKYDLKAKEILNFDLKKAYMDEYNKKEWYYENCKLISKDIFDLIKYMINIYIDKLKEVKCIFDSGEIIILIKDKNNEVINVGNLENRNDLKIKVVIEKSTPTPSEIFSKVKLSGFNYIKNGKFKSDEVIKSNSPLSNNNQDNKTEKEKEIILNFIYLKELNTLYIQ